jgi:hypothetical protein
MLSFSDLQPGSLGPRRVTQAEIRAVFEAGWKVDYIREAAFETRLDGHEIRAWLARITRAEQAREEPKQSTE